MGRKERQLGREPIRKILSVVIRCKRLRFRALGATRTEARAAAVGNVASWGHEHHPNSWESWVKWSSCPAEKDQLGNSQAISAHKPNRAQMISTQPV